MRKSSPYSLDARQMLLPLMSMIHHENKDEVVVEKDLPPIHVEVKKESSVDVNLSNSLIYHLHVRLLDFSLKQLTSSKVGVSSKKEIIDWMLEDIHPMNPLYAFSFNACCQVAGYNAKDLAQETEDELIFNGIHPYKKTKPSKRRFDSYKSHLDEDDI